MRSFLTVGTRLQGDICWVDMIGRNRRNSFFSILGRNSFNLKVFKIMYRQEIGPETSVQALKPQNMKFVELDVDGDLLELFLHILQPILQEASIQPLRPSSCCHIIVDQERTRKALSYAFFCRRPRRIGYYTDRAPSYPRIQLRPRQAAEELLEKRPPDRS